ALDLPAQKVRPVAEALRGRHRRVGDQRVVPDDQVPHAVEDPVTGLRRLLDLAADARVEALAYRGRRAVPHATALEDLARGRERHRLGTDGARPDDVRDRARDRKSTRLNSSHVAISYAVFCLKKKKTKSARQP